MTVSKSRLVMWRNRQRSYLHLPRKKSLQASKRRNSRHMVGSISLAPPAARATDTLRCRGRLRLRLGLSRRPIEGRERQVLVEPVERERALRTFAR